MINKKRPLSPHIQVYKPQMTSVLSIVHRITGVALSLGLIVFTLWLYSISEAGDFYNQFQVVVTSIVGKILLAGWVWALCYHLCTGIRHLFWDMGYGFKISTVYKSAWAILIVSAGLTLTILYCAW